MSDQNKGNNVVSLKDSRKKKKVETVRAGAASGRKKGNGADAAYEKALRAQRGGKGMPVSNVRWFHYVQVIAMLLLVAWLMKSCGGGG